MIKTDVDMDKKLDENSDNVSISEQNNLESDINKLSKPQNVSNIQKHPQYKNEILNLEKWVIIFPWWEQILALILSSSSCIFRYDSKSGKIITRKSHSKEDLNSSMPRFQSYKSAFNQEDMKIVLRKIEDQQRKLTGHRPLNLEERFSVTHNSDIYENNSSLDQKITIRPESQFYGLSLAHCSKEILGEFQNTIYEHFGISCSIMKQKIDSLESPYSKNSVFLNKQPKNEINSRNTRGIIKSNNKEPSYFTVYVLTTAKLMNRKHSKKIKIQHSSRQNLNYLVLQELLHWCFIDDQQTLDEITTYIPQSVTSDIEFEKAIHIPHMTHKQLVTDLVFNSDIKSAITTNNTPENLRNIVNSTSIPGFLINSPLRSKLSQRLWEIINQCKKDFLDHLSPTRKGVGNYKIENTIIQDDQELSFLKNIFPFQITSKIITWWLILSGTAFTSPFPYGDTNQRPIIFELLTDLPLTITQSLQIHFSNYNLHHKGFSDEFSVKTTGHSSRYPFLFNHQENLKKDISFSSQIYNGRGHYLPYHGLFQSSKDLQGYHNPYLRSWIIFEEDLTYFRKALDNSVLNKFREQLKDFQHLAYMYHVLDSIPEVKNTKKSVKVNQSSMRSQKAPQKSNKKRIVRSNENMNLNENIHEQMSPQLTKSEQELQNIIETYKPLNSSISPNLENNSENNTHLEAMSDDSEIESNVDIDADYTPSPQLLKKVTRTYNMGVRVWLTDKEKAGKSHYEVCHLRRSLEKQANSTIYSLQTKLRQRITPETIDTAIELVRDLKEKDKNKERRYSNKFASSKLGKLIKERNINEGLNDNFGQAPNSVLISAVNGMLDQEKKLQKFVDLFDSYPEEATTWLVMGRNPFLEKKLKYLLNVKFDYTRNLVLSARKILDRHLPVEMQIHAPFPNITLEQLSKATTDFITTKLNDLEEQVSFRKEDYDKKSPALTQRQKSFKLNLLTLQPYQDEVASLLNDAVQDWNNPQDTTPATRWTLLKQTAKKLSELINENADFPKKSTKTASNSSNTTFNTQKTKNKKNLTSFDVYQFNSILRGILMTALLPFFTTNTNRNKTNNNNTKNGQIVIVLKDNGVIRPEKLVSKPFMKKIRQNTPISFPLPLLMSKKYVITRPGNAKQLTTYVNDFGKFPIHIHPPQEPNTGVFVEVIVPKKVQEFIQKGATIDILRITSGSAPAHKIIVSLVLSGTYESFLLKKFIKSTPRMLRKDISIPVDALGIDLNRPGKHVVAFSEDDVTLPPILKKLSQRYIAKEQSIAHYQSQYERLKSLFLNPDTKPDSKNFKDLNHASKGFDNKKTLIKLRGEISRLYARRTRLLKELHREISRTISTILVRSQSLILCVEDLDISVRGKRGALAKAILSMPDEPDLVERACLVSEHITRRPIKLISVDPRNTSKGKHIGCSKNPPGTISRTSQSYDYAHCSSCDNKVNTHIHAAKVVKRRGLTYFSIPISSPS